MELTCLTLVASIGQSFLINNADTPTMELGESSLIWVVIFKIESVITFGVEFFKSLVPTRRIISSGDLWVIGLIKSSLSEILLRQKKI